MDDMKQKSFQFIDAHREAMVAIWQELVNMESGSGYKAGIDAVAARLQQELEGEGAVTKIVAMEKAGNMIIGEVGSGRAKPAVLFMGHMDTVFPVGTVAKRPFTIKDGKAYGPGVLGHEGGNCSISVCD